MHISDGPNKTCLSLAVLHITTQVTNLQKQRKTYFIHRLTSLSVRSIAILPLYGDRSCQHREGIYIGKWMTVRNQGRKPLQKPHLRTKAYFQRSDISVAHSISEASSANLMLSSIRLAAVEH